MNYFCKKIGVLLLLAFLCIQCTEDVVAEPINWIDWSEWDAKGRLEDKPAIVWIHTETCKECLEIEEEIFENPILAKYINENYYAASLLDTYKEDITTKGKTFSYVQRYSAIGYHELAYQLTKAQQLKAQLPPYPSIALLDKNFNLAFPITEMDRVDAKEMEVLLSYIKEEAFKEMKLAAYKAQFKSKL